MGAFLSLDCFGCHFFSASDNGTDGLWDLRLRGYVGQMEHGFQYAAVAYSANDGDTVYLGGIDNFINVLIILLIHVMFERVILLIKNTYRILEAVNTKNGVVFPV